MSVVHRFILSKTGKECQIETPSHNICCSLVIGTSRSVVKVEVMMSSASEIMLEKIVVDDSVNLIDYPISVSLSGAGASQSLTNYRRSLHMKCKIDESIRFTSFETYLVVLDGCKYQQPIRGWIHYRTA
jgi:hypothetical protein